MDIDPDRWQALLTAYRNAVDSSPPFALVQELQGRWARAHSDLEQFRARGATGQRDMRNPDVAATFQRDVAELEKRLADAEAEVRRVEALSKACAAKRSAFYALVESCRSWAAAQSPPIMLPGDDDAVRMPGFTTASVHVPQPAARAWP